MYDVVISTRQVIKLLPRPTEKHKTLNWSEWGPMSTRWFRSFPESPCSRIYGSCMYLTQNLQNFIAFNALAPHPYGDIGVVFCDFNHRPIRRYHSTKTREASGQSAAEPERLPAASTKMTDKVDSLDHSNIIYQRVITDKWILGSGPFTEAVCSRLPFRVLIRKQVEGWDQCPILGAEHLAIFSVSSARTLVLTSPSLTLEPSNYLGKPTFRYLLFQQ